MVVEERSSRPQAHYSGLAAELHYDVRPGISAHIRFPGEGPYDLRLGYSRLPVFIERRHRGYTVSAQANISLAWSRLPIAACSCLTPRRRRPGSVWLRRRRSHCGVSGAGFRILDEVPRLMSGSVSSRTANLTSVIPNHNPAIEWGPLRQGGGRSPWQMIDPDHDGGGGSTLATQDREIPPLAGRSHRPGQREAAADGFCPIRATWAARIPARSAGASCSNTNTVPLWARAGFGEKNGMGDGLWVGTGATSPK